MGLYDRDWYREEYRKKEKAYGGDFGLHSKKNAAESENQTSHHDTRTNPTPSSTHIKKRTNLNTTTIINQFAIFICPLFASLSVRLQNPPFSQPLFPALAAILSFYLFVSSIKRRKAYDNGILNAIAMISSMLSLAFSFVGLFFIIALKYKWI